MQLHSTSHAKIYPIIYLMCEKFDIRLTPGPPFAHITNRFKQGYGI